MGPNEWAHPMNGPHEWALGTPGAPLGTPGWLVPQEGPNYPYYNNIITNVLSHERPGALWRLCAAPSLLAVGAVAVLRAE